MNTYSSPPLGQVSASSLHEAARLLAGRAATAKYGRDGAVRVCREDGLSTDGAGTRFTAVIGAPLEWGAYKVTAVHFTVEMVEKPTLK